MTNKNVTGAHSVRAYLILREQVGLQVFVKLRLLRIIFFQCNGQTTPQFRCTHSFEKYKLFYRRLTVRLTANQSTLHLTPGHTELAGNHG